MSERDEITGALLNGDQARINREVFGVRHTTAATASYTSPLNYETLLATFDYFKPETLTLNGEAREVYGWKVHRAADGIIVMVEKMLPGDPHLGKMILIFERDGKAVLYDPAKSKPEPPPVEPPCLTFLDFGYPAAMYGPMLCSPYVPRAREVIQEKWPELICGPDDFFEVFDIVDA